MKTAPERIYRWLDTQLSVARYYGGCTYQGHRYIIAFNEPDQPLVRADVLAREAKERKDKAKQNKAAAQAAQEQLI